MKKAEVYLHGSFAATGKGHGTDRAIIAGLLGMKPDDLRIPVAFEEAKKAGMEFTIANKELKNAHPNTARVIMEMLMEEGGLMDEYRQNEKPLCGDFVSKVIANALKMGCNNACMKRIVAAPTAGACGVMPAVLCHLFQRVWCRGRSYDRGYVCGSRNRTGDCEPRISCRSIRRMSGRDRICIGNGCSGNMFGARWQAKLRWDMPVHGTQESDGACV